MRHSVSLAIALSLSLPVAAGDIEGEAHRAAVDAWHAQRLERLQAPDGWLSLVGLHWVEPGAHHIGSAPDNAIVLATGPEHLGVVTLAEGRLSFAPSDAGGAPAPAPDAGRIDIEPGRSSMEFLERGERRALRVRDSQAPTRLQFAGIERYPVDLGWRIEARFEAHPLGRTIDIANVTGSLDPTPNPGRLHFEIEGRPHSLEALDGGATQLFLIIADRTSGRDTYGAGRFIYIDLPVEGRAVIDFNKAYNPPCAFTAYSTCPLPPPENRLDLAVTAGEKRYRAPE